MLVNDILVKFRGFEFAGHRYQQERGYAFENRLMDNLGLPDRKISDYREPEFKAEIPMLLISPTVVNDGRKLYISPQPTSYFNLGLGREDVKLQGVDFRTLLKEQSADSLRYLTALRMSATFPYITPNVSLPTSPAIQIADAGITDNFGISDALTFLYVFRDWIQENTSGVVLMTIRDSPKESMTKAPERRSLTDRLFSPLRGVVGNWDHIQTLKNEQKFDFVNAIFEGGIQRVEFEYHARSGSHRQRERASLSWRLTENEKRSILNSINHPANQKAMAKLTGLLSD